MPDNQSATEMAQEKDRDLRYHCGPQTHPANAIPKASPR